MKNLPNKDLLKNLTPKEVVKELDRYIVGQSSAKKAVSIALRNRFRRKAVAEPMRDEIVPKNILMIGPTGVGKTEIARRLAKLANAPFIKVEATKFTEIGYVGRDVESMIRDLVEVSVKQLKEQTKEMVRKKAEKQTDARILEVLVGDSASKATTEKFTELLNSGALDDQSIEIKVRESSKSSPIPGFDLPGGGHVQMGMFALGDLLKGLESNKLKTRKLKVKQAKKIILQEEMEKLIDEEKTIKEAIILAENEGIIFIDEIDKIARSGESSGSRGEVSREGVQRDLLPIIEGSTVSTKYGLVKTDHILFIASGAFYNSKPSDLLPELQGRLPIRVELNDLTKDDLIRILKEPENSLIKQYIALLATEGVDLIFEDSAIDALAEIATKVNKEVENIGARRLHTILEKLLEDVSFNADLHSGKKFVVDNKYVNSELKDIAKEIDLSKFIL